MFTIPYKKCFSLFLAGAIIFLLCGCGNKATAQTPEDFVRAFVLATNKPDAGEIEKMTLAGGEEYYKSEAAKESKSEKEYYSSISDGKATDYDSFIDYQNGYRVNYLMSKFGSKKTQTDFIEIKSEKLPSDKLKRVKELMSEYDFIKVDKITDPYKVFCKFDMTISGEVTPLEMYFLVVRYDGVCKYVASTESSEDFDAGFEE